MGKQGKICEFIHQFQKAIILSQKHDKPPCTWLILFSLFLPANEYCLLQGPSNLFFFIVVALATDCPFCRILS